MTVEHQRKQSGMKDSKPLNDEEKVHLIKVLKARFEQFPDRHQNISWEDVNAKLESNPSKLWSLLEMEKSGGEPDVVAFDKTTNEYIFYDCSPESPAQRRSTAYDYEGQESRKEHKPKTNAIDLATQMGIEIMTETQYRHLQQLGTFDTKTSSWIQTPDAIRKLGGALFCDFRYDTVFVYHNGAQSYYAARGFRGVLRI